MMMMNIWTGNLLRPNAICALTLVASKQRLVAEATRSTSAIGGAFLDARIRKLAALRLARLKIPSQWLRTARGKYAARPSSRARSYARSVWHLTPK